MTRAGSVACSLVRRVPLCSTGRRILPATGSSRSSEAFHGPWAIGCLEVRPVGAADALSAETAQGLVGPVGLEPTTRGSAVGDPTTWRITLFEADPGRRLWWQLAVDFDGSWRTVELLGTAGRPQATIGRACQRRDWCGLRFASPTSLACAVVAESRRCLGRSRRPVGRVGLARD